MWGVWRGKWDSSLEATFSTREEAEKWAARAKVDEDAEMNDRGDELEPRSPPWDAYYTVDEIRVMDAADSTPTGWEKQ